MSNRAHKVAVTILIVLIILALAFLLRSLLNPPMPQLPVPRSVPVSQAADVATETVKANAHPIHKGGVHSVTELLRLINSDPGAAARSKKASLLKGIRRHDHFAGPAIARTRKRVPGCN